MKILLDAVSDKLQYGRVSLDNNHTFQIYSSSTYAIIGENGCGKSTLAKIIEKGWNIATNKILGDKKSLNIKSLEFSDIHSLTGCKDSYYQQRFEATANSSIPTVQEIVSGKIDESVWDDLCDKLSLKDIRHKRINYLSSGELRKFLLIQLFSSTPDILIIDNPYIGLDKPSRELLNNLIGKLVKNGTSVVLLLCNPMDIPDFTDYIIPMKNKMILPTLSYHDNDSLRKVDSLFDGELKITSLPETAEEQLVSYKIAFELKGCEVKYKHTTILDRISWRVNAGEKWALLGENGAGKSTLLSLAYADNPQGYKNDITIFDHRRGTGESIWDIKKRIGYISPEMHLYFNNGEDLITVVASGLYDNVGCFRRITDDQRVKAEQWLMLFGMEYLANQLFSSLSSGEQRLGLLARTFIKNAPILILDEPLHGLDSKRKKMVAEVIKIITAKENHTLIYVTHYQHEIPPLVTQVFRLYKKNKEE